MLVTTKIRTPKSHENCLLCGDKNRFGMKLEFHTIGDGEVSATLSSNKHHQGYEGILHGGFVASLLDSAMCNALFAIGVEAVTADMHIRYREEVPYNSEVELVGKVISKSKLLYKVEAKLLQDGKPVAEATSRFVKRR